MVPELVYYSLPPGSTEGLPRIQYIDWLKLGQLILKAYRCEYIPHTGDYNNGTPVQYHYRACLMETSPKHVGPQQLYRMTSGLTLTQCQ